MCVAWQPVLYCTVRIPLGLLSLSQVNECIELDSGRRSQKARSVQARRGAGAFADRYVKTGDTDKKAQIVARLLSLTPALLLLSHNANALLSLCSGDIDADPGMLMCSLQ